MNPIVHRPCEFWKAGKTPGKRVVWRPPPDDTARGNQPRSNLGGTFHHSRMALIMTATRNPIENDVPATRILSTTPFAVKTRH